MSTNVVDISKKYPYGTVVDLADDPQVIESLRQRGIEGRENIIAHFEAQGLSSKIFEVNPEGGDFEIEQDRCVGAFTLSVVQGRLLEAGDNLFVSEVMRIGGSLRVYKFEKLDF